MYTIYVSEHNVRLRYTGVSRESQQPKHIKTFVIEHCEGVCSGKMNHVLARACLHFADTCTAVR